MSADGLNTRQSGQDAFPNSFPLALQSVESGSGFSQSNGRRLLRADEATSVVHYRPVRSPGTQDPMNIDARPLDHDAPDSIAADTSTTDRQNNVIRNLHTFLQRWDRHRTFSPCCRLSRSTIFHGEGDHGTPAGGFIDIDRVPT